MQLLCSNSRKLNNFKCGFAIVDSLKIPRTEFLRSMVVFEARLPRKALAIRRRSLTSAFLVSTACSTKVLSQKCASAENFDCPQSVSNFCRTCCDKNTVWVHYNTFACVFTSVVLIRTLPGALSSFSLPITSLFRSVESTSCTDTL